MYWLQALTIPESLLLSSRRYCLHLRFFFMNTPFYYIIPLGYCQGFPCLLFFYQLHCLFLSLVVYCKKAFYLYFTPTKSDVSSIESGHPGEGEHL